MLTLSPVIKKKRFALLAILLLWLILHLVLRPGPSGRPVMIGHRGAGGLAPENTLAALRAALAHQAGGVEIDVSRSQDGVLLLMHDVTVDRTTNGSGAVADLPWATLGQLDAGSHFSANFAGEAIPTLAEALALCQSAATRLVIEVKDPELYPGLEQDLLTVIDSQAARSDVQVISFDHQFLARFQPLAPDVSLGALVYWTATAPTGPGLDMVSVFWPSVILDPTLVYRMHRAGLPVVVFSVNQPYLMRLLLWLGVDGLITDRPDQWSAAFNS
jgi:glycerophosphoryl diester phosphodiesterase